MDILGISAYYHDSAAALIRNGRIVAAAQEERFTRLRHDAAFPRAAIRFCLEQGGIPLDRLAAIVFYDKPFLKFERLLETYLAMAPRGFASFRQAMPIWLKEKLFQKSLLAKELKTLSGGAKNLPPLYFSEHHLSHAASAYYPSPFDDAIVLTLDGVGEWATTSVAEGRGPSLQIARELHFPHSLGLLYSAFTYYTGFKVNSGEYKVMGLAPYGKPVYLKRILDHLIDLKPDGSFRLDQSYFDYCTGLTMTNERFDSLFGGPPRRPEDPLEQRHLDLAASAQAAVEEILLKLTRALARETGARHLCLAGGVALNAVANGKIIRDQAFKEVWIPPAAGDAGGAIGAAYAAYHLTLAHPRPAPGETDGMGGALLGPSFAQDDIETRLQNIGAHFRVLGDSELFGRTAAALAEGKVVGWHQGAMEFGPRALGNRSILADPRDPAMQKTLNMKIKYRESFRPFAPAVLAEAAADWFELDRPSPYMLHVAPLAARHLLQQPEDEATIGLALLGNARSTVPAITHVDGSARVQTVDATVNPRFHALISAFAARTGCPMLINTSFNIRGEPIVCTPEEAFQCLMGTEMDILVVGNCYLERHDQKPELRRDYHHTVKPD